MRDDTDPYQGHDAGCACVDCCQADMIGCELYMSQDDLTDYKGALQLAREIASEGAEQ